MKRISELRKILNDKLAWNKARVDCLSRMLLALIAVRTVNLSEIATAFGSRAGLSSRYRRLQRFFSQFQVDYTRLAQWIFRLFIRKGQQFYVIIDRTNWYWGKQKINVFTLAIAYEGLAIPIFWKLLAKAGCSHFKEQRQLINRFINCFGSGQILGILADREFSSGHLLRWLNKKKLPFYIRIKEGSRVCIKSKKWLKAKALFKEVGANTHKSFPMAIDLFGARVFLAASRSERGQLMIVATNRHPATAVAIYLRRWEIESLFQGLKGRGFRFEETHMTRPARIEKLMAILAIAFCWAHKIGEWKAKALKPIIFKRHYNGLRPQNTYFRYGFDHLRDTVLNVFKQNIANFRECLRYLQDQLCLTEEVA